VRLNDLVGKHLRVGEIECGGIEELLIPAV
jgi:hypothetical protein